MAIVLGGLVLLGTVVAGIGWNWAFHDLPPSPTSAAELWATRREPSVTLMDREGHVLAVRGPLYARAVALDALPEHVPQAFLAIEDQRYYEHGGVDLRGVIRALWVNFRAGRSVQGGSTITMQLVKNLILSPDRELRRKIQEMRLARQLETHLSKTEILELYLNRIYLGARACWRPCPRRRAGLTRRSISPPPRPAPRPCSMPCSRPAISTRTPMTRRSPNRPRRSPTRLIPTPRRTGAMPLTMPSPRRPPSSLPKCPTWSFTPRSTRPCRAPPMTLSRTC